MLTKGYGYEDYIERIEVLEDEDGLSAAQKFEAQIVAAFDYLLVRRTRPRSSTS